MSAEYPGAAERIAEVVALVGDSKWIWSAFGVVQNWARPVATGPFTVDQVVMQLGTFTIVTFYLSQVSPYHMHVYKNNHMHALYQVNEPGVHMPVVYDRQFYKDIFKQYAELLSQSRAEQVQVPYPEGLDPRRAKQHFEKFYRIDS